MSDADMQALMARIWAERRDGVIARLEPIDGALDAAADGALDADARERARREAHTLAGSVGTFGFAAASGMARELEVALRGDGPVAPADVPALRETARALRAALEGEPET